MSISRFTPEQVQKITSGDGYYLKVVENEQGQNTWSLIRLNCIQQLFRWLGLCYGETHLQLIGEKMKDERDVPQELKERILACWNKTFFDQLDLQESAPAVVEVAPEYKPLAKALNALPEKIVDSDLVDNKGEWEPIPAELFIEEAKVDAKAEELAIDPAEYNVKLKNPALKRLAHNICSSEICLVEGTWIIFEGGDLLRTNAKAIVNPTSNRLIYDPFLDKENLICRAIHTAAGPELNDFCETVERVHPGADLRLKSGTAVVTSSGELEERGILHIIHTPVSQDLETLAQSVKDCLDQSYNEMIKSIAIPLLNMENAGIPLDKVVETALRAVKDFLENKFTVLDSVKFVFKDNNEDNAMEFVLATAQAKEIAKDW